ncbi:uncharacterized protein LOC129588821 isoform X1 [Paramacrobiotus metropolitanus]|uniref:uncharacterized protein LOC129588821 isoform X1 n=1 Tax=Paramacrobiotus metropolitanus TaxID=2943436 RepID=UPI002445C83E|nr:uncharacterized protein LOC129588821 isoform X1 [Paramacrobiotus metropolitanus]XP_055339183.1 uncharacterized protein LOC129588821 isoform X1 [Paramacrobiotus metropolitanus]
MGTIDRLRCRRTCPLWDEIICLPELCRVVDATFHDRDGDVILGGNYVTYACILTQITAGTRTLCIPFRDDYENYRGRSPEGQHRSEIAAALGYIQQVLRETGTCIERLVLYYRDMHNFCLIACLEDYFNNLAQTYSSIAPWCPRIIWINYTWRYYVASFSFCVRIPYAVFSTHLIGTAQVRGLFERHVDSDRGLDQGRMHSCISSAIRAKSKTKCATIIEILKAFQSDDPRPSANYSTQEWTLNNLDCLDIRKLNPICLVALSRFVEMSTKSLLQMSDSSEEDNAEDEHNDGVKDQEND